MYRYTVKFIGAAEVIVNAWSRREAVILACAERVKLGHHIDAYRIINNDTGDINDLDASKGALSVNWEE
jgi:hypothetical protein